MFRLKKTVAGALMLAAMLSVSGCGSDAGGAKKVVFSAHSEATDFTGKLLDGVKTQAGQKGLEVEFLNANGDANLQIDQLSAAIEEKPAAIILLAVEGEAIIPAVEKANEAGIPVIATNRDVKGGRFAMVMSDERQAGKLQGEYMAKHLPPDAKVVYLQGEGSQSSAIQRWEGFKETCLDKRPDIKLLAKADGKWNESEGLKYMTLWLQVFPQIDGVIAGNDSMAYGAMKALKAAGKEGVLISGVDALDFALEAVAAGDVSQTVKQDADKTVEEIGKLLQKALGGTVPDDDVRVPFTEITKENIAEFK